MQHEHHEHRSNRTNEYIKLFIILGIVILLGYLTRDFTSLADSLMAWFFLIFGSFKLLGYKMFTATFPDYDLISKFFPPYAKFYPFLEIIFGFFFLGQLALPSSLLIALVIITQASTLFGILRLKSKMRQYECACLGSVVKLPLSTISLLENISMIILAILSLTL